MPRRKALNPEPEPTMLAHRSVGGEAVLRGEVLVPVQPGDWVVIINGVPHVLTDTEYRREYPGEA